MSGDAMFAHWPEDILIWSVNLLLIFVGIGLFLQYLRDLWLLRGQRLGCILGPYIYVISLLTVCILGGALLGPLLLIRDIIAHLGLPNYSVDFVLAMVRVGVTTSSALLLCTVAYHRMKIDYGSSHYANKDHNNSNLRTGMLKSLIILLLPFGAVVVISATDTCSEAEKCTQTRLNKFDLSLVTFGGLCAGILSVLCKIKSRLPGLISRMMVKQRNNQVHPHFIRVTGQKDTTLDKASTKTISLNSDGSLQKHYVNNVNTFGKVDIFTIDDNQSDVHFSKMAGSGNPKKNIQRMVTPLSVHNEDSLGVVANHRGICQRNNVSVETLPAVSESDVGSLGSSQLNHSHIWSLYKTPTYSNFDIRLSVSRKVPTPWDDSSAFSDVFDFSTDNEYETAVVECAGKNSHTGNAHSARISKECDCLAKAPRNKETECMSCGPKGKHAVDAASGDGSEAKVFQNTVTICKQGSQLPDNMNAGHSDNVGQENAGTAWQHKICQELTQVHHQQQQNMDPKYSKTFAENDSVGNRVNQETNVPSNPTVRNTLSPNLNHVATKLHSPGISPIQCHGQEFSISKNVPTLQSIPEHTRLNLYRFPVDRNQEKTEIFDETIFIEKIKTITHNTGILTILLVVTQLPFLTGNFLFPLTDSKYFATVSSCFSVLQIVWFLVPSMMFLLKHKAVNTSETS